MSPGGVLRAAAPGDPTHATLGCHCWVGTPVPVGSGWWHRWLSPLSPSSVSALCQGSESCSLSPPPQPPRGDEPCVPTLSPTVCGSIPATGRGGTHGCPASGAACPPRGAVLGLPRGIAHPGAGYGERSERGWERPRADQARAVWEGQRDLGERLGQEAEAFPCKGSYKGEDCKREGCLQKGGVSAKRGSSKWGGGQNGGLCIALCVHSARFQAASGRSRAQLCALTREQAGLIFSQGTGLGTGSHRSQ